jgi:hypothetical protein
METRSITLYSRPECELCAEALEALRQIVATSPTPLVINEVNVEGDPVLHQRLLTEIPAVEYQEQLLSHATSRMRIATFIANVDDAVQHV